MVSISEYSRRLAEFCASWRQARVRSLEQLSIRPAASRLAADVVAEIPVPPFDNSQMDGFAVLADDAQVRAGSPVPLLPMAPAGHEPATVAPGHALPVMTGSKLPEVEVPGGELPRADAPLTVIPVEATVDGFDDVESVRFTADADFSPGAFVRPAGSDIPAGSVIARAGDPLSPALLGVCAAAGVAELEVIGPVRVLVVSTGDELAAPGGPRGSAQIYDASTYSVTAALQAAGAEVMGHLHVRDDAQELLSRIAKWQADPARRADLVVSMGGISMGAREVIRMAAAQDSESTMEFVSVAMQPGGPQAFGLLAGVPWIALPGNPVSSLVTIEVVLRPAVFGTPRPLTRVTVRTPGGQPLSSPARKTQVRVTTERADGGLEVTANPSSHLLLGYARARALTFIPTGVDVIRDGDEFDALFL